MADDSTGYAGQAGVTAPNNARNSAHFQAKQQIAGVRTMFPAKVVAVHYPNGGGPDTPGPPPTIDIQPLVNQTDGQNNATPHGVIYGIQAPRNRSGTMEIINDPVVGDMGHVHVADRDFSSFIATNAQASPGSDRRHSMSDGVWVRGHNPGTTPKQYIHARTDGVTVMDVNGHQVTTNANGIQVAPKDAGHMVMLGGTGSDGSYDFVMTASGPSVNVKARIG